MLLVSSPWASLLLLSRALSQHIHRRQRAEDAEQPKLLFAIRLCRRVGRYSPANCLPAKSCRISSSAEAVLGWLYLTSYLPRAADRRVSTAKQTHESHIFQRAIDSRKIEKSQTRPFTYIKPSRRLPALSATPPHTRPCRPTYHPSA